MDEKNFETKASSSEADVIRFYDTYAEHWDGRFGDAPSNGWFLERRWRSFSEMLARTHVACENAIELGVGTGVYIGKSSAVFGRIVAVDGSERMLAVLRERLRSQKIENVETLQANVLDLSAIQSDSVDCVYFFGLIEHVIHLNAFVLEIQRVLKPGGVVIGVTPNGRSPWYRLRKLFRGTGKHCSSDTYHSEESLDALFLGQRFSKVHFEYWGAVPAGATGLFAKVLCKMERLLESSPIKTLLGGLTFAYRK